MDSKKKQIVEKYKSEEKMLISDLRTITELLRAPDGCPWDREQTHESIRENFIEETYEVAEAIDISDTGLLEEELGDVLLQVVFHACIEEENGGFDFDDVTNGICRKLVLRHPHVFGNVSADTTEQVLSNWDKIKQESKHQTTVAETRRSVAKSLPALMRAEKLIGRAAKAGYLDEAVPQNGSSIGEKMLRLVLEAREAGLDAEHELYKACDELISRVEISENSKSSKS